MAPLHCGPRLYDLCFVPFLYSVQVYVVYTEGKVYEINQCLDRPMQSTWERFLNLVLTTPLLQFLKSIFQPLIKGKAKFFERELG